MSAVRERVRRLYGDDALLTEGVVHVVYTTRGPSGLLHAVRIGSAAPRSETDFFVLNLCRARADALLTSAENLRREPLLSHALAGESAPLLRRYRTALGKADAPRCAVLTRTGDLPEPHPFWSDGTSKLLLTDATRVAALATRYAQRAQLVGLEPCTAPSACRWLRAHGSGLISVEAGPSTAQTLYGPEPLVDELLLTIWDTTHAPIEMLAGALPADEQLFRGLTLAGQSRRTEGAAFVFQRWVGARHARG